MEHRAWTRNDWEFRWGPGTALSQGNIILGTWAVLSWKGSCQLGLLTVYATSQRGREDHKALTWVYDAPYLLLGSEDSLYSEVLMAAR